MYDIVAGGLLYHGEIIRVEPTEVVFALHEELESDTALPLHLLLAVFKFDHMEWAIEKATELGVERITPVLARRTEKHLSQAAVKRAERWRRIALESSKQSRRTIIPIISEPSPLKPLLESTKESIRILLSETEQNTSIASILSTTTGAGTYALAIGPEGGWTAEEMELFSVHQWQPVTLGPRILRAETAAISAIAILSSNLA
jgi:16S rRNA (uracil1498-N3)-methyltransferase